MTRTFNNQLQTFKKGSTTFFYSSLFFPKKIWKDVVVLYAYVRTLDDMVDQPSPDVAAIKAAIEKSNAGTHVEPFVADFLELSKRKQFKKEWIESFHQAMLDDIPKKAGQKIIYQTYAQLQAYMYGSAEVIGLFMARILSLSDASYTSARFQAEAMQLINFIRDIHEDEMLNRQYVPQEDLVRFGVSSIAVAPTTIAEKEKFFSLMRFELDRYFSLQSDAEKGYHFIPLRYRIPVATAAELYKWTAGQIKKNPLVVYEKKVKPSKLRVCMTLFTSTIKWGVLRG